MCQFNGIANNLGHQQAFSRDDLLQQLGYYSMGLGVTIVPKLTPMDVYKMAPKTIVGNYMRNK